MNKHNILSPPLLSGLERKNFQSGIQKLPGNGSLSVKSRWTDLAIAKTDSNNQSKC